MLTDPAAKQKWQQSQGGGFPGFGGVDWSNITDMFSQFGKRAQQGTTNRVYTDVELSFKESCFGTEKDISFSYNKECKSCDGVGAKKGDYETCSACGGTGQNTRKFGNVVFSGGVCSQCKGKGVIIKKACEDCNGQGFSVERQTQSVAFPSCIDNGTVMNFRVDESTVLTLRIFVKAPQDQMRSGIDIYAQQKVGLKEALLGGKIKVQTLHGEKSVSLKECTGPDTKVRLKNCGAKHPHKEQYGHHILIIDVDFPKNLTAEQKAKLEEVFS